MVSRAPEARAKRRREIVDVATRLLGENGYGRTTMDDIAAAASVTKRTLYRYVPTKQDVLPMIHERFMRAAEELIPAGGHSEDAAARIAAFVEAYVRVVVEHQSAVRVFFEEEYNLTPDARTLIVARRDAFEERFRALIRLGISVGVFRDCDIEIVSAGMFGAMANVYRWYSPTGQMSVPEIAGLLSGLLLDGLAEPKPREPATGTAPAPEHFLDTSAVGPVEVKVPEAVLSAAVELFATQGYLETNTREIADAAGVTKSGLFYHIGSKEDLLFVLQHRFAVETLHDLERWIEEARPRGAVAQLRELLLKHSRVMGARPRQVRVFVDQTRYLSDDRRHEIEDLRSRYADGFEAVIRWGTADGVFRDVHPRITALALLGMLNSMSRWFRPSGRLTADQIGEVFADLVLQGLLSRSSRRPAGLDQPA